MDQPKRVAAGHPAVLVALRHSLAQMGPLRTAATLAKVNQRDGFDCPGCAWLEEPGGRRLAEFCENGAKAVAEEATRRMVTPEFFVHILSRTWPASPSTGCPSRAGSPTRC